jgi:hypothetical protein
LIILIQSNLLRFLWITVKDVMKNRVGESSRKGYIRNGALFLAYMVQHQPELVTDDFKAKFPLPWGNEAKKGVRKHLEEAPDSAAPLNFGEVEGEHVLGEIFLRLPPAAP